MDGRRATIIGLTLWCGLLFACAVAAFTSHNDFPLYFHPDEPSKVAQLLEREFNFRHPQLLLLTTDVASYLLGMREPLQVGVVGRSISAVAAAVAVVALTLLAYRLRGWAGALAAGVIVLLNPTLGYLAHFMKEDCVFLMGLSLWLLALIGYLQQQSWRRLALLGVACGVAASAKYLGAACVGVGLVVALLKPIPSVARARSSGLMLLCAVATGLVLNVHILVNPVKAMKGLHAEINHAAFGHLGFNLRVPHLLYAEEFKAMSPIVLVFAAIYLVGLAAEWRKRSADERITALFPVCFFVLLCFSSLVNMRYFLPVSVTLTLLAGLGLADVARLVERLAKAEKMRLAPVAAGVGAAVIAALFVGPFVRASVTAFRDDPRFALRTWIAESLPPTAVIAQQHGVGLLDPGDDETPPAPFDPSLEQKVLILATFPEDIHTFQQIVDEGVTHVVLMTGRYLLFEDPYDTLDESLVPSYLHHRDFYRQVLARGRLVWSADYPHGVHRIARTSYQAEISRRLNEKLEVFELSPATPTAAAQP